jgi:hypothetical protein
MREDAYVAPKKKRYMPMPMNTPRAPPRDASIRGQWST